MKVKAIYKARNPFMLNPNRLEYSVTINVPNDTNMEKLKKSACEQAQSGYLLSSFEQVKQIDTSGKRVEQNGEFRYEKRYRKIK